MGKGPSKPTQQIELSLNHPRFTNAKFIINEKQRNMETVMGVDNKEYQKWRDRLHKDSPAPQYLLLPVKEQFSSKGLCGSSGSLTLDFQDFPYLLTQQMAHRKGKKRLFQQNQLWYLLFALITAKKDMKPSFSKIGDIRPHNVFINDQGQIKVANTYSWPRQHTNFTKAFDNQTTYLAPQQIKQLQMGIAQSDINNQSQIFSIGLTLLSAATLQDFINVYDIKKYKINLNQINEKLNEFKLNRAYSDIMKGVICNLCQFDQNKRIKSQQLYNWIAPHQQSIKSRQNFYIPSAPQKIHHQVAQVRQSIQQLSGLGGVGGVGGVGVGSSHLQQNRQQQFDTHNSPTGIRQSGFNGQNKLNFPPPIVRQTTYQGTTNTNTTGLHPNFVNIPNSTQAQSLYIPASNINRVSGGDIKTNTGTVTATSTYQYGTGTAEFGTTGTTGTAGTGKNITTTTNTTSNQPYISNSSSNTPYGNKLSETSSQPSSSTQPINNNNQTISKKQISNSKPQSEVTPSK